MPLDQADRDEITGIVTAAVTTAVEAALSGVDNRINSAKFGGPTVQVAPTDLVWLGGRYVSASKGHIYEKRQGRLVDMGPIPEPL